MAQVLDGDLSQAELQQRLDDAAGLYTFLQQNEGIDQDGLVAWAASIGRTADDLAAAMDLLVSWGRVYPVQGNPIMPPPPTPPATNPPQPPLPEQPGATAPAPTPAAHDARVAELAALPQAELRALARQHDIAGRSTMDHGALAAAVAAYEAQQHGG